MGNLMQTYMRRRRYEQSSAVMKQVHLGAYMEEALQRITYESEYNTAWTPTVSIQQAQILAMAAPQPDQFCRTVNFFLWKLLWRISPPQLLSTW